MSKRIRDLVATQDGKNAAGLTPYEILDRAIDKYQPRYVFVMFSGGDDSLATLLSVKDHPRIDGAIFLDTGIGIPQNKQYVIDTCADLGVELVISSALDVTKADGTPDPQCYRDMVLGGGIFIGCALMSQPPNAS